MTPGFVIFQRVLDTRRIDAEAEALLVDALVRWDRDGGDGAALLRYMGLPTTTAKRRQDVRDRWLCAASDILGGDSAPERARRLDKACKRFRNFWSLWRDLPSPPSHASDVDGCLFFAAKAGRLPEFKQLRNILAEAF